ncbi:3288_t:CDS:2, partial [Funneliformis geosporum]
MIVQIIVPILHASHFIHKNQLRETNGRFGTSKKFKETHQIYENFEDFGVEEVEKNLEESLVVDEWGDEEDSGWEDDGWEDEEKQKRGPYLVGSTKKSTYYDKWGPNGIYTVAASNTKNITDYFSFATKDSNYTLLSDIGDEILEGLDNIDEEGSWTSNNSLQKVSTLKAELEKSHKKMSVIEYNKKKAIFEYLQRLDENGKGKMYVSMEAAKIVFINAGSYKATMVRKWAAYWLKTGYLLWFIMESIKRPCVFLMMKISPTDAKLGYDHK